MKVGVTGVAHVHAQPYAELLRALGHEVIGFAEKDSELATAWSAATGIPRRGLVETLEDAEAMVVAGTTLGHAEAVEQVAAAGLPMLVEKPLATTAADVATITEVLEGSASTLMPAFPARFSHGYGDLRHMPAILVEDHALKPYRQRVLGDYVLLEQTLKALASDGAALKAAIAEDRKLRGPEVIAWKAKATPVRDIPFLPMQSEYYRSPASGAEEVRWLGNPAPAAVYPLFGSEPAVTVTPPAAYWVSAADAQVIDRLRLQFGRLDITPEELEGRNQRSALFKTMFLAFRAAGAKDWRSHLAIALDHSGSQHRLQFHHIFPKALLRGSYTPREADDIANLAFIGGKTNRSISDKDPHVYFPSILEKSGEAAFATQCIPLNDEFLVKDHYKAFLAERRRLIAARLNAFLGVTTPEK